MLSTSCSSSATRSATSSSFSSAREMRRECFHAPNNAINDAPRRSPVDNLWQTSGNESRMTAGRAGSAAAGGGDRNLVEKWVKKRGLWVVGVASLLDRLHPTSRKY